MDAARRSAIGRLGADRLLTVASLTLLTLLAWAYLLLAASPPEGDSMSSMDMGPMPMGGSMAAMGAMPAHWTAATFGLMLLMWWAMMIGMMLPSALPTSLLHARVQAHHRSDRSEASLLSLLFAAGYLVAWAAFSIVATAAQWGLTAIGTLTSETMSVGPEIGAALFALAGLYQLSPLKSACLRHCRSPAEFLASHHRPGGYGAFVTGAHHGLYCVGCCWMLMALLFAVGIMNLLWVAALAAFVLVEKLLPRGLWIARGGGVLMLAAAGYLLLA